MIVIAAAGGALALVAVGLVVCWVLRRRYNWMVYRRGADELPRHEYPGDMGTAVVARYGSDGDEHTGDGVELAACNRDSPMMEPLGDSNELSPGISPGAPGSPGNAQAEYTASRDNSPTPAERKASVDALKRCHTSPSLASSAEASPERLKRPPPSSGGLCQE